MRRAAQTFGVIFILLAIGLLLAAVLTTSWTIIDVNGSIAAENADKLAYYSRSRGVYKECWDSDTLSAVIESNDYYISGQCLRLDTRVLNIRNDVQYTQPYNIRAGLLVAFWVVVAVTGLFMIICIVLVVYSLFKSVNTYQWKHSCKACAALMFSAAFLNALAMAFFHGAEYMELHVVSDNYGQAPYSMFFARDFSQDLANATTRMYSWSYALSWLAVGCEIFSACIFSVISCCYVKKAKAKKLIYSQPSSNTGTATRNPAYDHMEDKVIVAPPQVYIMNDEYYLGGQRGSYDPYATGQHQSTYSPRYNYDKGWQMN